ncbi:hypothetical protein HK100_006099 [Physocladia obscura]|uniref:Uncharacterized protein n=1 Tax=Physocladia obscura TaxID=109957 RepID=A0AAD5X8Z1_9FUNG|nr:hypothetical protein HK100_006099 [Physocladia obscura]
MPSIGGLRSLLRRAAPAAWRLGGGARRGPSVNCKFKSRIPSNHAKRPNPSHIATLYMFTDEYTKAISAVNKLAILPNAISFFSPKSDFSNTMRAMRDIFYGLIYFFKGEYTTALPLLENPYETIHRYGDRTAQTDISKSCYGICLLFTGSVENPRRVLEERMAVMADGSISADSLQSIEQCLGLAMVYQALGRSREALPLLDRVFPVTKLHYKGEIWLRATRAKVYADLGRFKQFAGARYGPNDTYTKMAVDEIVKLQGNL